jgi:hypothetical protein
MRSECAHRRAADEHGQDVVPLAADAISISSSSETRTVLSTTSARQNSLSDAIPSLPVNQFHIRVVAKVVLDRHAIVAPPGILPWASSAISEIPQQKPHVRAHRVTPRTR